MLPVLSENAIWDRSSGPTLVSMVQSANLSQLDDLPELAP